MKVLIATYHRLNLWIAPEWFSARLTKDFLDIEVVRLTNYDGIEQEISDAEVVFTSSLRPEQFHAARRLRWIHSPAAAVHPLLFPELVNSDVILTNARDVHGAVVAEHVIALIFALAKQIPRAVRFQQQHVWGQEAVWQGSLRPREIAGTTLGLVGLGSIGRNVAKRAAGLGMLVIAVRERAEQKPPDFVEECFPTARLNEMLAQADYVVLAIPITPATKGIIGRDQLAKMKPDACLINVGRGPSIDEPALIEALRNRTIGGAALDVFDTEPLPAESPLWNLENLLITPHTAGMTDKLWERHYDLFSENLRRYQRGETLLALVDKRRGY